MAANSLYILSDLALEVAQNYGSTDDVTLAKAKKWINRALMRINEMGDWSWLMTFDATFNTVTSTESYTLAAGVKKIYSVFILSNVRRRLQLLDDRIFRQFFLNPTTVTGTPEYYRLYGRDATTGRRKIALYPTPSSVIAVYYDYRKEVALLTSDTDDVRVVTGMPDHMIDALIELATAIGMRELDDSDYESAMGEAVARWQRLLEEDSTEVDDAVRLRAFDDDTGALADPVLPPQYS